MTHLETKLPVPEQPPADLVEDPSAHAAGTDDDSVTSLAAVKVIFAGYGVYSVVRHVTAKVQSMYDDPINPTRIFYADNSFWGDPVPGSRKYLFIVWTNTVGTLRAAVVGENDVGIKLP